MSLVITLVISIEIISIPRFSWIFIWNRILSIVGIILYIFVVVRLWGFRILTILFISVVWWTILVLLTVFSVKLRIIWLLSVITIIIAVNSVKRIGQLIFMVLILFSILKVSIIPGRRPSSHMWWILSTMVIMSLSITFSTFLRLWTVRTTIGRRPFYVIVSMPVSWRSVTISMSIRLPVWWWRAWPTSWWITFWTFAGRLISFFITSTLNVEPLTIIRVFWIKLFWDWYFFLLVGVWLWWLT